MEDGRVRRRIRVYDCRTENQTQDAVRRLEATGLDFNGFLLLLHREFGIHSHDTYVLTTSDRKPLDFDRFEELQDNNTLLLLQHEHQVLPVATEDHIKFSPHYNTLIQAGTYEYYASEGQKSLPFALAELIDNSLSATAKNPGGRTIEIRMVFDDSLGKPALIVLDNGCGMTSKQLNNWAVYRLNKFSREEDGYVPPDPVRRSLNSDISYFGVGGKQAVFYIGDSARMISKPVGSPDVHELFLSKEDFEKKERNKEEIFCGIIRNRKPGDSSHVNKPDERFLHSLIKEESGKESFTAVVIMGILPEHINYLRQDFEAWTRQLAHIYHYYIHGVNGKDLRAASSTISDHQIDIQITLREKPPKCPRALNLREVDNDMQTLYISSAVDTFEFKAAEKDGGKVEGVIRYHPFLYDKETYPEDPSDAPLDDDDDDDNESGVQQHAKRERPIFHCFWNGRLIPYTTVSEFDWCSPSRGTKDLAECYNRVSGVLFTDDKFKVSTNKLTYMELELKLKHKDTIFTRIVNGQNHRVNIQREFTQWLKNCHEKWDKQVKFLGYKETITRTDVPVKRMQHPWATFSSIEYDGKTYTEGQLVKSLKTQPILYCSVVRFLLYGEHHGDVHATGGQVEVAVEPKALHDQIKTIPITKIDKKATQEAIKKNIDNDYAKLPEILKVDYPEGNPWLQDAVRPAGTPLGPLRIEILNKKGESISTMPSVGHGAGKKLVIELNIVKHGPRGDVEVFTCPPARYSAKWGYCIKKNDQMTDLGKYTLTLNTVINESNATTFGGRELPSYKLKFTISAGSAERFVISDVSPTIRIGVPFDIPLLIKDGYNHSVTSPPDLKPELKCRPRPQQCIALLPWVTPVFPQAGGAPTVIYCSGLDLSYETVDTSGTTFTIRSVKARGKVQNYLKLYGLTVIMPGLKKDTQAIKISVLPGNPHSLHVTPEDDPITVENGQPVTFNVEVHDEAGNITAHPRQIVSCQVEGLRPATTDCSTTGAGQLTTKPINLKIIKGEPQNLKVQFEMPSQKEMALVVRTLKVVPSTRVSRMEICRADDKNLVLRNDEKIVWLAGGLLENLLYKLYDEAGREVPPTAEIASMIKVNWTGDVNMEDLVQGKLPDIQVPTQVPTQVQEAGRFYQVSYQDQRVSVSFKIVPRPDEPTRLKATLLQSTVKLGEILPGNISLELVDKYDNLTKTLTSTCENGMIVEAEGLDKSTVVFRWQEDSSCVLVTGVQFQSGTPGPRDMCFTYESYVARVTITVNAGVPAQLKLVSGPVEPLQVLNDQGITTPFLVQLYDEWGNPSTDQRVVVQVNSSPSTLKVTTSVTSQPVDAEGKASFTVNSVSGPKGNYRLEFKGSLNLIPIPGPSVKLTVIPDPTKPVSLSVEYNTNAMFPAGGVFPVFSVTVVSDEGSPITTFNPAAASMYLWKGVPSGNKPPQEATELKCSKPMKNEKNDRFHFRDKEIPEHVGKHTIQFALKIVETNVLFSDQITINVVANQPVKLGPDSQQSTPVVSYSKDITNRTLVENMTLRIMDKYGNPAGQDLDGNVVVSIKNLNEEGNKTLPLFEGKTNSLKMSLVEGKAHIPRLAIMENSVGENGNAYILLFKPEVPMVPMSLDAYELLFLFYNDAENQRKMSELSRKKDELTTAVAKYEVMFTDHSDLAAMLASSHKSASGKEAELRAVLINKKVEIAQTIPDIDRLLREKDAEAQRIQKAPRRRFSTTDPYGGKPDVLGMVGHLALVQDDNDAWVISWHISGDMKCVITRTTAAAQKIYAITGGSQEVMPLESVFVPRYNRPMPHIKDGRNLFEPSGNPVFARDLLQYPNDPESCKNAFKNLLRDVILIDDLDSANDYRVKAARNQISCPTILTRKGERISANGKFGGDRNRAPPINKLLVFGAPLPQHYYGLKEHMDLLRQYRSALEKKDQAKKELDDHLREMRSPKFLKDKQEMEEHKKQLEEIELQLGSTPVRPEKRGLADAGEPSGINPKRAKQRST